MRVTCRDCGQTGCLPLRRLCRQCYNKRKRGRATHCYGLFAVGERSRESQGPPYIGLAAIERRLRISRYADAVATHAAIPYDPDERRRTPA